jgi:hypothetical protein
MPFGLIQVIKCPFGYICVWQTTNTLPISGLVFFSIYFFPLVVHAPFASRESSCMGQKGDLYSKDKRNKQPDCFDSCLSQSDWMRERHKDGYHPRDGLWSVHNTTCVCEEAHLLRTFFVSVARCLPALFCVVVSIVTIFFTGYRLVLLVCVLV